MRGDDQRTGNLFAYVNIEERIRRQGKFFNSLLRMLSVRAYRQCRQEAAFTLIPAAVEDRSRLKHVAQRGGHGEPARGGRAVRSGAGVLRDQR